MDHKLRLKELAEFLQPYQRIWQNEIMLCWPHPFDDYPQEWVEELSRITDKDALIKLERKEISGLGFSTSLEGFYRRIAELTRADATVDENPLVGGPFSFLYMIPKKEHEIRRLAPFIAKFHREHHCEKIIDIGGGIGFLAQSLANEYSLPLISLDMDPVLQATGRDRHLINSRVPKNRVEYKNLIVSKDLPDFVELLDQQTMTIGLHTCGHLAVDQMTVSSAKRIRGIVNFGCCYHKLNDAGDGQNTSSFAQGLPSPVWMKQYALTLASRAHRKMDEKDFDFKLQVKRFRYAIHFLLRSSYARSGMDNLGNSPRSLYEGSFANYAKEQLARLKLESRHSDNEFEQYYRGPETQKTIHGMLAATHIRDAMGRALEMYLLVDRAIYLEEQGYQVEILEFFDESISPRNLGIAAYL